LSDHEKYLKKRGGELGIGKKSLILISTYSADKTTARLFLKTNSEIVLEKNDFVFFTMDQ